MKFFSHLTFDLDDTLLDTSGALIPAAARRSVQAMIAAVKSPDSPDLWLAKRTEILRTNPRADVWLTLAKGEDEIADIGRRSFFTLNFDSLPPDSVRPTPGAFEILKWCAERAALHLVTSGDPITQKKKIELLGVASYFETIQYVDPKHAYGRTKNQAFAATQEKYAGLKPTDFVSIGNRVDMDLGEAKVLGWKTAWVHYGEHARLTPQRPEEIPDFEVASLSDLLSIWRQLFVTETATATTTAES